jgi:hypothetical protein
LTSFGLAAGQIPEMLKLGEAPPHHQISVDPDVCLVAKLPRVRDALNKLAQAAA